MARKPNEHLSLYLLKLTGMGALFIGASILAPAFPYQAVKHLLKKKFKTDYNDRQIASSIRYLKRKQFIAFENKQSKFRAVMTKLGKRHLKQISIDLIKIKPHAWDGKWRIVMFDIPEDHKSARHAFRRRLQELNFVHFQRSVFLLPFRCEEEIKTIANALNVLPDVHVLTAERFRHDTKLLKKFNIHP